MAFRQRMATPIIILLLLALPGLIPAYAQESPGLGLSSARYIVVDAETGYIYAEYNARQRVAIASVTKMFTAVQALEMASLDTVLTTKDWDLRTPDGNYFGSSGTLMGFGAGEQYTLRDLLYGMMLPSGNDAANTIARELGYQEGDTDAEAAQRFMDLLNQRIVDMGLTDTHFMNPSGWGVDDHYSTAADVATFGRLAANYPVLMAIMGTSSYTTANGAITVSNTNRSLTEYPSVFAGKTGYDWDSGYCLINFATRTDGGTMIAVNLDGVAPGGWYSDNVSLLDYGFDQRATLVGSGNAFDGEIAAFQDPAPAEIARSTSSDASFAQSPDLAAPDTTAPARPNPPPQLVIADDPPLPVYLARPAIWGTVVVAIGLLGFRGFLTFRDRPAPARQATLGDSAAPATSTELPPDRTPTTPEPAQSIH